jgi:hypothetical protein
MAEATEKANTSKKNRIGSVFLWILAAGFLFAFYESIVLLLIGMIPTIVALVIDRSPHKDQARSVGYLNFAGCLPWAVDFWVSGGNFDRVFEIVSDPLVLAVMYSAAATGWALCFIVRPFVAAYLTVAADYRESQLTKRQEELVEEWGEEVREALPESQTEEGAEGAAD